MAFKISKTDQKRINDAVDKFTDQKGKVDIAVSDYNEAVNEARGRVDDELSVLNDARSELAGILDDIHSEMQDQYDDMSEKWLEGERADPTQTWIDAIDEIKSEIDDDIMIEEALDMEFDISDLETKLEEGIPSEPEY